MKIFFFYFDSHRIYFLSLKKYIKNWMEEEFPWKFWSKGEWFSVENWFLLREIFVCGKIFDMNDIKGYWNVCLLVSDFEGKRNFLGRNSYVENKVNWIDFLFKIFWVERPHSWQWENNFGGIIFKIIFRAKLYQKTQSKRYWVGSSFV